MTMSRGRSVLGRATVLAVSLPLAAGVLVAGAPAAGASVTAPGDGTVFTSYGSFEIRAEYPRSSSDHRLTLTSPGGSAVTVDTAPAGLEGGTMTYSLDTGCWVYPSTSCTGKRRAPNGTWTVTQSGGGSGSSTFITRIRPEAPTSVSATALNPSEVRVSWRLGDEPDLTGWDVLEGSDVVKGGVGRGACSNGTCSVVIGYPTEGSGEHTYTVKAYRSVAPGSTATLSSGLSAPASARLDKPAPPPEPTPESATGEPAADPAGEPAAGPAGDPSTSTGPGTGPSSGPSTGPSTAAGTSPGGESSDGGTAAGGGPSSGGDAGPIGTATSAGGPSADAAAVAQRKAFALTFSAFGPKLGIPKLPPLPQAQTPAIAPELADGTFNPTLGFQDQVVQERVEVAQPRTERVRSVVGTALDSERLLRSTAGALVLLLLGAHLRRWLSAAAKEH